MESRIGSTLTLYAFSTLGLFLLIAPWTPVWGQAAFSLVPKSLESWFLSGWARGLVSGLGALDLAMAVQVTGEVWPSARRHESDKKKAARFRRRPRV